MRPCTVCKSPQRATIEDALLRKESSARISERVGLSNWAILRHGKHLERGIVVERMPVDANVTLLERIEHVILRVDAIASAATFAKNWSAATLALRELRRCLELLAKVTGQLQLGGRPITVAVGLNISNREQPRAGDMTDADLDRQLAMDVAEATHGFDPHEIERLRRLSQTTYLQSG